MVSILHRHQFTFFVSSNHKTVLIWCCCCWFLCFSCSISLSSIIAKWKLCWVEVISGTSANALFSACSIGHTCTSIWYRFDFQTLETVTVFPVRERAFDFRFMFIRSLCADSNESLVSEHVQNSYESANHLGRSEWNKKRARLFHLCSCPLPCT